MNQDRQPVEVLHHAPSFWSDPARVVARTALPNGEEVVTEFTGVEVIVPHYDRMRYDQAPLLFQTRLGKRVVDRYRTWDEARRGHHGHIRGLGSAAPRQEG